MIEKFTDPLVLAAIVSAITSILTVLIIKPILDRKLLAYKLEKEHQYDQKRKIKEIIASNKIQMINSAEDLSNRLRGFLKLKSDDPNRIYWSKLNKGDKYDDDYLISTIYRFITFFGSLIKFKQAAFYIDTTVAEKGDLELVKFVQVFPQIFCGSHLFNNANTSITKENIEKDRFKTNEFIQICSLLNVDDTIVSYAEFKENYWTIYKRKVQLINDFFVDINPEENNRLRWDVLQIFWFFLASFLNTYGYDYQRVSEERIVRTIKRGKKPRLLLGFEKLIRDNKLQAQTSIKKMINIMRREYKNFD